MVGCWRRGEKHRQVGTREREGSSDVGLEMKEIKQTMPQTGTVQWIGLRPGPRENVRVVDEARVGTCGIEGDHFNGTDGALRTVTLIQQEHMEAVASILGKEAIDPALLRRNIVVSGINLAALKKIEFQIGEVILFGTNYCPPCSRMEENLGAGGYNAMIGHGGITANVVQAGVIRKGDSVRVKRDSC